MIGLSPWEAVLALAAAWFFGVLLLDAAPVVACIAKGIRARRRAQKDWDQGR
jgi:hypothetical protein